MHTYLFVFEVYIKTDKNYDKIHNKLANYLCKAIMNESAYIIRSEKTAKEIYQDFLPLFPNRTLFVTEINLEHSAGQIWDETANWINYQCQTPYFDEFNLRK